MWVGGGGKNDKTRPNTRSGWVNASLCLPYKHHNLSPTWHMTQTKYTETTAVSTAPFFFVWGGQGGSSPTRKYYRNITLGIGCVCGGGNCKKRPSTKILLAQCIYVPTL